jgi:hypothetical protein
MINREEVNVSSFLNKWQRIDFNTM